ncbi:hypothetical protein AGMMS49543_20670 [Betaproteobacteria bacterium]|nr:hypothetical protein AGMMS49543_20670 [Betaproteobacteria bacterium]
MGFDPNGKFHRLFSWVQRVADGYPEISATDMDADTDEICKGLEQCITRDGKTIKPKADMDWDGHRITGLGDGKDANDAINLKQLSIGTAHMYTDTNQDTSNRTISIDLKYDTDLSVSTTGLRLFVYLPKPYNKGSGSIKVKAGSRTYPIKDLQTYAVDGYLREQTIIELVFVWVGGATGGTFYLIDSTRNLADSSLSNVASVYTTTSCIKDYIIRSSRVLAAGNTGTIPDTFSVKKYNSDIIEMSWTERLLFSVNQTQRKGNIDVYKKPATNFQPSLEFADANYCLTYGTHHDRVFKSLIISNKSSVGFDYEYNRSEPQSITTETYISFNLIGRGKIHGV